MQLDLSVPVVVIDHNHKVHNLHNFTRASNLTAFSVVNLMTSTKCGSFLLFAFILQVFKKSHDKHHTVNYIIIYSLCSCSVSALDAAIPYPCVVKCIRLYIHRKEGARCNQYVF